MSTTEEERLDVQDAIDRLQAALRLQYRSAPAYTIAAGSLVGSDSATACERRR